MSVCSSPSGGGKPALSGTVTIDKTSPKVGDTLTASYADGNGTGTPTWQWFAGDDPIEDANSAAYTVAASDLGKTLTARVSFADQDGTITSAATKAVAESTKPALTGTVTIDKTSPEVGDTLTAEYAGGNGTGDRAWQWLADDVPIEGANSDTYTVTASELDKTLAARVSFADQSGSVSSEPTAPVTETTKPALSGTVAISNMSPKVGDTLTAEYKDGNGSGTSTWQWLANGELIPDTNSDTYVVADSDLGKTLAARVSFADQSGNKSSAATAAVAEAAKPALTGTVTINNTSPAIGDTLTAEYADGNGTGEPAWQWLANGEPIPNTNSDTYVVADSDLGKTLVARVHYTNQSGTINSITTAAVAAASKPALSGTLTINNMFPKVGDTLTAEYSSGNGTGDSTWQWLANNITIGGANSDTYVVVEADLGKTLVARLSYSNQSGSVSSVATAAVANLTFTVTFNTNGGIPQPSPQTINNGTYATRPADPAKTGYTFVNWYKDSGCTVLWNFGGDTITADTTIYAKWNIKTYTVSFNTGEGSYISNQYVAYQGTANRPTDPFRYGYVLRNWYKEASFTTIYDFSTPVTGDLTLYARWGVPVTASQDIADFGSGSFIDETFTVYSSGDWNTARDKINTGGRNRNYILNVSSSFSIPGGSGVFAASDVNVSIRSYSGTLSLSGTGYLLECGNSYNTNLKIIIRDLTLQGTSSNDRPLVYVAGLGRAGGSTLELKGYAKVTGNTNNRPWDNTAYFKAYAGGVYVGHYGTFIMRDNASITDNKVVAYHPHSWMSDVSATAMGGGIYNSTGIVILRDSASITGNTTSSYSENGKAYTQGGGVYHYGGYFRMAGGTISGNTAAEGSSLYAAYTAEYGYFNGETWVNRGSLPTTNNTITVVNGVLQ